LIAFFKLVFFFNFRIIRYTKPEVISTFSDASETMLRDMNRDRPKNDSFVYPQLNLMSEKDLTLSHRMFHCYFVDFDSRFFNSKCLSEAFIDLLRATYALYILYIFCTPN
jgi:hypothetical protein